ncbi:Uncharacterized protein Rs2_07860 [Raphanus sativus]|nr:Uncharacterized protein Rs2_07860 [Raphanus sativus]
MSWPQVFCPKDGDLSGSQYPNLLTMIASTLVTTRSSLSSFTDIELWITIALSRPLRELEIDVVSKERSLILPSSLYIYLGHTRALVTQQLRFPERSSVRLSPVSKNSEPGACRLH